MEIYYYDHFQSCIDGHTHFQVKSRKQNQFVEHTNDKDIIVSYKKKCLEDAEDIH